MLIGARIPSPWYERVLDPYLSAPVPRTCSRCGAQWNGTEVPIWDDWPGALPEFCPKHPTTRGKRLHSFSPGVAVTKGYTVTEAGAKAAMLGGYLRRYECTHPDCDLRWTTMEVSSDGVVVEAIHLCPRCGGFSRQSVNSRGRQPSRKARQVLAHHAYRKLQERQGAPPLPVDPDASADPVEAGSPGEDPVTLAEPAHVTAQVTLNANGDPTDPPAPGEPAEEEPVEPSDPGGDEDGSDLGDGGGEPGSGDRGQGE